MSQQWIVIPRWHGGTEGFQHYKDRDPKWIKNYTRLLHDDAYRRLSGHRRSILHGLWLAYAMSGKRVAVDPKMVGGQLGLVVKMADLEALNHAGFIAFSASAPCDEDASPEEEKSRGEQTREETEKTRKKFVVPIAVARELQASRENLTEEDAA